MAPEESDCPTLVRSACRSFGCAHRPKETPFYTGGLGGSPAFHTLNKCVEPTTVSTLCQRKCGSNNRFHTLRLKCVLQVSDKQVCVQRMACVRATYCVCIATNCVCASVPKYQCRAIIVNFTGTINVEQSVWNHHCGTINAGHCGNLNMHRQPNEPLAQ